MSQKGWLDDDDQATQGGADGSSLPAFSSPTLDQHSTAPRRVSAGLFDDDTSPAELLPTQPPAASRVTALPDDEIFGSSTSRRKPQERPITPQPATGVAGDMAKSSLRAIQTVLEGVSVRVQPVLSRRPPKSVQIGVGVGVILASVIGWMVTRSPSPITEGNSGSSQAITVNRELPQTTEDDQGRPTTTADNGGSSTATTNERGQPRLNGNDQEQLRATANSHDQPKTSANNFRLPETTTNSRGQSRSTTDNASATAITGNTQQQPPLTVANPQQPKETSNNLEQPKANTNNASSTQATANNAGSPRTPVGIPRSPQTTEANVGSPQTTTVSPRPSTTTTNDRGKPTANAVSQGGAQTPVNNGGIPRVAPPVSTPRTTAGNTPSPTAPIDKESTNGSTVATNEAEIEAWFDQLDTKESDTKKPPKP